VTGGGGSLTFASPAWLGPAAVALAAAAIVVLWGWRRASAGGLALGLKLAGFLLLAVWLVEPAWTTRHARPGSNLLAILADDSRSMNLRDGGRGPTRGELMRGELAPDRPWLRQVGETFQLRRYLFEGRLRRSQDFAELFASPGAFAGPSSDLGAALRAVTERYRGGPLAGIVVFSDGNATDLDDAAAAAAVPDVAGMPPVYPVVVGSADRRADLALGNVTVTQTAFEDAPVTIAAEVRAVGQGRRTVTAALVDEQGKVVQTESLPLAGDEEQRLTARFRLRPPRPGASFYRVKVDAGAGAPEVTDANNARLVLVDRPRGPYRILYLGGRPNWEYKFIRRAVDEDSEVQLVAVLRIALREPKFAFGDRSSDGSGSNPLFRGFAGAPDTERYDQPVLVRLGTRDAAELAGGFPKSAEELFAYHAVILDDLEAGFFTGDQLALLERFVADRGGGLLMLGGPGSLRQGHYDRTPLASVLPVYLDRMAEAPPVPPVRITLSREGWLEAWTRLRDNEPAERDRLAGMPPFLSFGRVRGIKPGATVLATASAGTGNPYPALVVQRFGSGRAGVLAVGDMWRWAMGRAEVQPDLARFWRQTVRWLVTEVPERVGVRVERRAAGGSAGADSPGGQALAVRVRVRDPAHQPADDAAVSVEVTGPGGEKATLPAIPAASEAGLYEARYLPRQGGGYRFRARVTPPAPAAGAPAAAVAAASFPDAEAGHALDLEADEHRSLGANHAAMESLARRTGGRLLALGDLEAFARELPARGGPVAETRSRPLWHGWWTFAAALACFAAEWTLRRRRGLP
jgi:uncharacterized membrane protein